MTFIKRCGMTVCKFCNMLIRCRSALISIFIEMLSMEINPQKEQTQPSRLRINSVYPANEKTAQGDGLRILLESVVVQIL